ncbi:MAG: A/G-specific adenine glycosylase, partial [Bacteroidia bacterium]|nr:A/G-specific adenine glycosylase [Bacteroidia bacterium]
LGYYSRARNMHHAAKTIFKEFKGEFPSDINEIKKLKGVGTYTSAAIASFAFNKPHAVVVGNVYRVLSRYLGIKEPIDSTTGKKEFEKNAESLLDKKNPGIYNQAIMEFGAKQCRPVNPECNLCPLKTSCYAFNKNEVEMLPIKSKKVKQRKRYFNYLLINYEDKVYISKRIKNDIWKNLFEFPLIETDKKIDKKDLINTNEWKELVTVKDYEIKSPPQLFKHILTHQKIEASFWEININGTLSNVKNNLILVKNSELANYAVPRLIDRFLEIKFVY